MKQIIFDSDLAAIHGYLCSDGYVQRLKETGRTYYRIGLRNTNMNLLSDFQSRFKKVFKQTPTISKRIDRCSISNKEAHTYLLKEFGSFHSYEWTAPKKFNNKTEISLWLGAFFDAEGTVKSTKAKDRSISMECVNKKGIREIQKMLFENFKIVSKIFPRKNRSTEVLYIFGKENIIKFQKEIGFLHEKKSLKLDDAVNSYITYEWIFPDKKSELKKFVIQKMREKSKMGKYGCVRFCSNKRENLLKLADGLSEFFRIEARVSNERFNGIGTKFFELNINKKSEVGKVISN